MMDGDTAVPKFTRDDGKEIPRLLLRFRVEGLAELHDVDSGLTEGGTDGRGRVGLTGLDLEFEDGRDFFGHDVLIGLAASAGDARNSGTCGSQLEPPKGWQIS